MQALFIPGSSGKLFGIFFSPVNQPIKLAIVHIPAFADEMNKSRRMVNLQAQAFAAQGYAVLLLDLFGSGDSDGEFNQATWEIWLCDIGSAIRWLKAQGAQTIDLWGLRTGALLAMHFADRHPQQIQRIICWQPVVSGEKFITQFLRLHIAVNLMHKQRSGKTVVDLSTQLRNGHSIEVAGYLLHPELINPLSALHAHQFNLKTIEEIAIFAVEPSAENSVTPSLGEWFSRLQANHVPSSLTTAVGHLFWTSLEITENTDLIRLSTEKIQRWLCND